MADKDIQKVEPIETGELALRCAEFFMALSETCYQYYNTCDSFLIPDRTEKQRKTKMIAKNKKNKQRMRIRNDEDHDDKGDDQIKKKLPKKPLTAYIIYFQEKKPQFVEKHPDLNLSELTKLIAKQWKEISDGERKPYLDQAQEDRKRYDQQLKEFKTKYGTNIFSVGDNQNSIQQENVSGQNLENGKKKGKEDFGQDEDRQKMDIE